MPTTVRRTLLALSTLALAAGPAAAQDKPRVEPVWGGTSSITGETIRYPTATPAEVKAVVITLAPGQSTGWHRHGVPLFGYILDGELTVAYDGQGSRQYPAGTGFMEGMATTHNGTNTGAVPCRILAVFMGDAGAALTATAEAPPP